MIKILTLIFVFFALSRAILRFKDKSIKVSELALWMLVWTAALILVFFPNVSSRIAVDLGMQRGADTAFFVSIILLFYLVFRMYVKIDTLDKHITDLAVETSKKFHKHKKNN